MVVVKRLLSCGLRHRHGKFASRNLISKQHVADGIASFGATEPHVHDGLYVVVFPRQHGRTTREVEQHNGLSCLHKVGKQLALHVGHLQRATACALATHVGSLAHSTNYDVSLCCCRHRLCLQLRLIASCDGLSQLSVFLQLCVTPHVAALRINQSGFAVECACHAFAQGGVAVRSLCHTPRARHVVACVGERTDKRHSALLL